LLGTVFSGKNGFTKNLARTGNNKNDLKINNFDDHQNNYVHLN